MEEKEDGFGGGGGGSRVGEEGVYVGVQLTSLPRPNSTS